MDYLSKLAAKLTPYTAGEQPIHCKAKLNTNENPYPPSKKALEAGMRAINDDLRRYPRADGGEFKKAAAKIENVDESMVFCSNGSDEALALAFAAFFDTDAAVFTPEISYSFYPVWANYYGIPLKYIAMSADFEINALDFYHAPGGAVLANPNAPTGRALDLVQVEGIVKNNARVVIVDEAYCAFGGESAVPLTKKYENLLVIKTLSKSHSLAGLRAGYTVGSSMLINGLERIRDSFNSYPTDALAQRVAAAALLDTEYTFHNISRIMKTREWVIQELADASIHVIPSKANFIFVRVEEAENVFEQLKKSGVYVRYFNRPKIDSFLRVTIGTDEEMRLFIKELKALVCCR